MSDASVSEFACGKTRFDDQGRPASCTRKRWHAGDHRGTVGGRLVEWPDPPAMLPEAPLLAPPRLELLDESTETWEVLEAAQAPREALERAATALVWVLVAVLATGWPVALVWAVGQLT